ncbi:hypothetical protein TRFO_22717 [Tritrichomonas foetus]|uniref:Uncharacterized protein n=1 Tax=Tritrichomonas foetus TaxID=1144522 RepID=A0A1J4KCH6_9EUKA|nr:hypothetical protein TRFO_22717 [Tritrichomonas foetus]|eukprot:OHT08640.1 hypothetical protein TRFO_22717 [Tritrichomonas foetus]
MALHCVNYKLKTNERYLNEMERERPLSESEDHLIKTMFKENYRIPIHNWALIQKDGKRAKLFAFLRTQSTGELRTRGFREFTTSRRMPELVLQTPTTTIDFNRAIFGDQSRRPMNKHKFESKGIKDGVFGYARPYTAQPVEKVNYGLFIAKKLLVPNAVSKVEDKCEQYEGLLTELLKWVEKKANDFPIDPIRKHPNLNPVNEGRLTKEKLSEDHIYATTHKALKVHPLQRSLRRRDTSNINSFWSTNYQDNFCDEIHRGKMPPPQKSFKQLDNPAPFAVFPCNNEPIERAYNALIMEQAETNRKMGKINFQILNGKTCL